MPGIPRSVMIQHVRSANPDGTWVTPPSAMAPGIMYFCGTGYTDAGDIGLDLINDGGIEAFEYRTKGAPSRGKFTTAYYCIGAGTALPLY